ncbi:hypothetical protein NDU88_001757 [Pleurodeles waltl]|uniref:Uncharacterized protein n=1 Tax=Pleurodeles waltl TaxID=8319 RepID=A0AAV7V8N6_PLEWA|nr:hypothetical protein NDU88_001757 [Pleurodeles waltl]
MATVPPPPLVQSSFSVPPRPHNRLRHTSISHIRAAGGHNGLTNLQNQGPEHRVIITPVRRTLYPSTPTPVDQVLHQQSTTRPAEVTQKEGRGREGVRAEGPPQYDLTAEWPPGDPSTPPTLPSKGGPPYRQSFPAGGALRPPNARPGPRGRPTSRPRGLGLHSKAAIPRRGERPSIVEETKWGACATTPSPIWPPKAPQ